MHLLLLASAVLLLGCSDRPATDRAASAPEQRFPEAGSQSPDVLLTPYPDAEPAVQLAAQQGKVVVLSFWASWCGPCQEELPELSALAARYRDEGLVVYPILHDDDAPTAREWLAKYQVELPMFIDPGKRVARQFGVRGLPDAYLIGRDGRLVRWQQGYEGPGHWERRLREALGLESPA